MMKKITLSLSALALSVAIPLQAQISYDTTGMEHAEGFNSLLGNFDSFNPKPWTDNSTIAGWYATEDGYVAQGNPVNTSTMYNLRFDGGSTDMTLGSVPGLGSGDISFGVRLTNDTGSILNSFDLQYTGEQWRNSGNEAATQLLVSFRLGGEEFAGGSWNFLNDLTFNAIHTGGTAGNLNGKQAANRVTLGATFDDGFSWQPGQDLWVQWTHPDAGGTNHALGVDNMTFAAIPEPGHIGALLAGLSGIFLAIWRRRFNN